MTAVVDAIVQTIAPVGDARDGLPPRRRDVLRRPRLVSGLSDASAPPLVVLVAPAGYGKTTLLCDWAEHDGRPFAWLSLDERDNDPDRLLAAVTRAVDAAMSDGRDGRVVLVLDDIHVLQSRAALHVLAAIATDLPPGMTLALASRTEPALPLARWRAERALMELRTRELAMTPVEASAVFRIAGLRLDRLGVETLAHRTEGWPVVVSLASLLADGDTTVRLTGAERQVVDYVREEILSELPAERREFVLRTSVLETLTGPLCDAVVGGSGSAVVLSELARANVPIAPLDRRSERYRYHGLFAEALRAELRRVSPSLVLELHRRASAWYRAAGDADAAIRHALAGGDVDGAGELVCESAATAITHGRAGTIECWLGRFSEAQMDASPALALAAASRHLVMGEGDMVEHWAAVAASAAPEPRPPAIDTAIALLRASVAQHGIRRMREDAARAAARVPEDSPCRALCWFVGGIAAHLSGARAEGERELHEAARRAAVTAPILHALCLTQLAVLAIEREDWEAAAGLTTRARSQVDRFRLADDTISALVFAVSALVRAQRGRVEEAQHDLDDATRLAAQLVDFAPWYESELRILMARAALRLCDASAAHERLVEASRPVRRVAEAPVLEAWLDDAWARLDEFASSTSAPQCPLTTAELRILQFLPTHLSFREIGERTYVSANTVKTQANSVYRKLDVCCRSEAVTRARGLGLIDAS